jgi:hypothetical protein
MRWGKYGLLKDFQKVDLGGTLIVLALAAGFPYQSVMSKELRK